MIWWLTGRLIRQSCTAGYKAMWSPDDGLPQASSSRRRTQVSTPPPRSSAISSLPWERVRETLNAAAASAIGLPESVAVAVGNVDSFVSVPGAGVSGGHYVTVVGTSICDMLLRPAEVRLPGITGVVRGRDPARHLRL